MATKVLGDTERRVMRSRAEWRQHLLDEIASISAILEADSATGDTLRHLPSTTLDALKNTELLKIKLPSELGGAEADNALQFEIFEQMGYHNAAAAWCYFIYADQVGRLAALLPDEGVGAVFGSEIPLICGGGGMLMGDLAPAEGGYRVSGRWVYGSGIVGSKWTAVIAADKNAEGGPDVRLCVFPTSDIVNEDNWNTIGLRATGSSDFHAKDLFVPGHLTFSLTQKPVRGGGLFRLGMMGYVSHTVPAVVLGIAQRALDDVVELAKSKVRGYNKRGALVDRATFQAFVAASDLRLKACRALMLENGLRIAEVAEGEESTDAIEAEVRAAGTYITAIAVEVVDLAVRYAGGEATRKGSRLEQALRDIHIAATHFAINDISLENHAQFLMDLEGADAMA